MTRGNFNRGSFFCFVVLFGLLGLFGLFGCSGGGGDTTAGPAPIVSTTLSGTAAAGAPIIGTVTIKDSTIPTAKTKVVTIAAEAHTPLMSPTSRALSC